MRGVVLVIGAPGAGKTSLLEALCNELERDGVAFGALESEQLGWGHPALPMHTVAEQLAVVLDRQEASGRELFLVAATPETQEELSLLKGACAADELLTVCVTARPQTVVRRLQRREDEDWVGREALIARARELAETIPSLVGIDVRLDSEGAERRELAAALRPRLSLLTRASRGA